MCAFCAPAAQAHVRFGSEVGGGARLSVMSWSEIPFRSVIHQKYDFSCGSAAVATMLSYHYGRRTGEDEVFSAMWHLGDQQAIRKEGFSMLDMKIYLDSLGYEARGFRITPEQLKKIDKPAIVLLNIRGYRHFVVVKGFSDDRVLVGDPMFGINQYSLAEFASLWNGIVLQITDDRAEQLAVYNLPRDWGPWATAPLSTPSNVPVSRVTENFPPVYQITPQVLLGADLSVAP